MRGCHRPILLAFVTFLVNGLTYAQNNEPNCGTFCLASQTTCTCTLSEGAVTWEVRNASGGVVGQRTFEEGDDDTVLFGKNNTAASAFGLTVSNSTSGTLNSELSFTTLSEYQGYEIECRVDGVPFIRTINIAGIPSIADLNLTTFTTNSVVLAFEVTAGGDCVANYTVTTNASVPSSSINDTRVTISRPPNDPVNATYFVCVSAVDTAERAEPRSCLNCFRFSLPSAVIFYDVVYTPMMSNDVCTATIEWTPYNCLPPLTSYNVIVNSSAEVTMTNVSIATFQISNVVFEEKYTVTVTPSNTFGTGMPAFTTFTAPTVCPVMMESTSPSPTSGSASMLFTGPGVLSVGLIAGFIISFGFPAIIF